MGVKCRTSAWPMPGTESLLGHVVCNIEAQSGVSPDDDDETVVRRASISLTDSLRLRESLGLEHSPHRCFLPRIFPLPLPTNPYS